MALAYDFDIFRIIPDFGPSDAGLSGLLKDVAATAQQDSMTVALFRDARTAEALRRAPSSLRTYLLESGFGLNTYSSGAPAGHYPASDEAVRLDLIQRLADNARRFALPSPEDSAEGGDAFRLGAFLEALEQSQPIVMARQDPPEAQPNADQTAVQVTPRRRSLPPLRPAELFAATAVVEAAAPVRRKFWQSRSFRIGATAVLLLGAMQMVSGPALMVLASL